jgi:hypothetical protein
MLPKLDPRAVDASARIPEIVMHAHPNPSTGESMLSMLLPEDMQLRIALLTVDGRELRTLYEGRRERGPFTLPVTLSGLRTGVYLRVLRGGGYRGVTRIVAIK